MWLSGLHIPESYLTALIQAACRKNGWPLDRSTLYTTVTGFVSESEITERTPTGCFIQGLYLEGASWDLDESALSKPIPKQLVYELPILKVIPIEAQKLKLQVSHLENSEEVLTPGYRKVFFYILFSSFVEHAAHTGVRDVRAKKCYGCRSRV